MSLLEASKAVVDAYQRLLDQQKPTEERRNALRKAIKELRLVIANEEARKESR